MEDFGVKFLRESDIEKMSVYDLRHFLISKGITVANSRKADLVMLAKAAVSLGLPGNVDHHEDKFDLQERLIIKGTRVPDPFSIPVNQFTNRLNHVPPFGIEDIFNFLIFKSSDYNRQKIASYKAFEEYGLFQDGYVQELRVKELDSGHFVFVGSVKPTMITETKSGAKSYKLWFVMDGERKTEGQDKNVMWSPTAGSIFSGYCLCPGGQDGACKHIAAALYSLHDCIHPETGPTDELCYWKKRETKSTNPAPITAIKIGKASSLMKKHKMEERQNTKLKQKSQAVKCKEKNRGPLKDNITYDPRAPFDRNGFLDNELNIIKRDLTQFQCVAGKFITSDSEDDGFEDVTLTDDDESETHKQTDPFIFKKAKIFLDSGKTSHDQFLNELQISEEEKAVIESTTRDQGEFWKLQRQGFITSTKIKDAFTRQKAIDTDSTKMGDSVAKRLLETDSMSKYSKLPAQLQYGRDNESEARKEYKKLMTTTHSNFKLQTSGLQVCTKHPYIAVSPDNIRSCKCCETGIVEYKCPYKNRNKHPREAFLDPSIGGTILKDGTYALNTNHKYYFQVQGTMAAVDIKTCDLVIFTLSSETGSDGGIFIVKIPFSRVFWDTVTSNIERFYLKWMLPIIFEDIKPQNETGDLYLEADTETPAEVEELMEIEETTVQETGIINVEEIDDTRSFELVTLQGVPLFKEDIDSLSDQGWLTDNVIVMGTRMLLQQRLVPLPANVQVLESILYLSLSGHIKSGKTIEEATVKASAYVKNVSPSSVLIVPICEHGHWFVLILSSTSIIVMDSLSHARGGVITRNEQIELLLNFLQIKFQLDWLDAPRYVMKVPQQANSTDCGMYLLLNVAKFLQPEIYECYVQDSSKLCHMDHTAWFNQDVVQRERTLIRQFIVNNIAN